MRLMIYLILSLKRNSVQRSHDVFSKTIICSKKPFNGEKREGDTQYIYKGRGEINQIMKENKGAILMELMKILRTEQL